MTTWLHYLCHFLQVASLETLVREVGRDGIASPDRFLKALDSLESSPAFTSERAVVELQIVWNLATEVCFY